jgi:hypothetical protein
MVSFMSQSLYAQGKNPSTHFIGGWVGPRADLDAVKQRKISCPCKKSNPGHPAQRPLIYQLSYPTSVKGLFLYFPLQVLPEIKNHSD